MAIFFYCGRLSSAQLHVHICSTVASSEAPADYQPAPGRTDGVPERHQRQWIINPSLQICAWNFCPGAPMRVPSDSEKTPACIHVIQRLSQPRVAC